MSVRHVYPRFKVDSYCQNISEFHILSSLEQTPFKKAELFHMTKVPCDFFFFPRKLSFYINLSRFLQMSALTLACFAHMKFLAWWAHLHGLFLPNHTFDYSFCVPCAFGTQQRVVYSCIAANCFWITQWFTKQLHFYMSMSYILHVKATSRIPISQNLSGYGSISHSMWGQQYQPHKNPCPQPHWPCSKY